MVDYGKMADSGKADAISTDAIEMAAPAITRKELLDRLGVEFPEASHAVGDY